MQPLGCVFYCAKEIAQCYNHIPPLEIRAPYTNFHFYILALGTSPLTEV